MKIYSETVLRMSVGCCTTLHFHFPPLRLANKSSLIDNDLYRREKLFVFAVTILM